MSDHSNNREPWRKALGALAVCATTCSLVVAAPTAMAVDAAGPTVGSTETTDKTNPGKTDPEQPDKTDPGKTDPAEDPIEALKDIKLMVGGTADADFNYKTSGRDAQTAITVPQGVTYEFANLPEGWTQSKGDVDIDLHTYIIEIHAPEDQNFTVKYYFKYAETKYSIGDLKDLKFVDSSTGEALQGFDYRESGPFAIASQTNLKVEGLPDGWTYVLTLTNATNAQVTITSPDKLYNKLYRLVMPDLGFSFKDSGNAEVDGKTREFRGGETVKRQDMAAFLYRWAGSPEYTPTNADKEKFSDVDESTPHAKAIWWLASQKISEGWPTADGSREFRGMSTVKRQDMAAFMHRLVVNKGPAFSNNDLTFTDVNVTTSHALDIKWLAATGVSEGWTEPDGSRTFRGMSTVKRQDMAAFLQRLAGVSDADAKKAVWDGWKGDLSYFLDVNSSTAHSWSIWWLGMKKVSQGWEVKETTEPEQPDTSEPDESEGESAPVDPDVTKTPESEES